MNVENYRMLLGCVFLWALLPFPFLYILMPPFWIAAAAVALTVVLKPSVNLRPSGLVLNLIGVAVVLLVLVAGGIRVGPLRPLGHLLVLLTSVRVLTVSDRRSFLRALLLVFIVWVVALTSSTHVTVVLYFAASAVLWWWIGVTAHLDGLGFGIQGRIPTPRLRHVAAAAVAALLLSVPIFVALPRLQSPWIAGRGGVSSVTGFTSHVDLAGVGTIRQSHQVAMVVRSVSGEAISPDWMRLRATALQRVTLDSWAPRGAYLEPEMVNGVVRLHGDDRRLADAAELEIELVRPRRYLFLPEGAVALVCPVAVKMDPTGGVVLASRPSGPVTYRVWVARDDPPRFADPPTGNAPAFELDPAVHQLALDVVGESRSDAERAAKIEAFLRKNFGYSLSGMTLQRADPVSWFLLHERQGHCEYFAGAMVALLYDVGVPARMVAGYSGGNLSLDGEEAVIRQANAHTWVEAWIGDGDTWSTFDPTPEADIPALARPSGTERIRWAADWVQSTWDRHVLTFGFGEQVQLVTAMTRGFKAVLRPSAWRYAVWILVAIGVLAIGWWATVRRRTPSGRMARPLSGPAADMVDRIARRLERNGLTVPPGATIRWIARAARSEWPGAGAAISDLAWLAERELYARGGPRKSDRASVRNLWKRAQKGMRNTR